MNKNITTNEIRFATFLSDIHTNLDNGIKLLPYETDLIIRARYDHLKLDDDMHSIEFTYDKRTDHYFIYILSEFDCAVYDEVATTDREFVEAVQEVNRIVNRGDYAC